MATDTGDTTKKRDIEAFQRGEKIDRTLRPPFEGRV